ncbi:short-chain dehydrogenase reductase 2a-like [Typha latifolia]|uniref:short-chain dehydrogenase reductase 2a-like n=1 Tax=Typha latifolia TaxID=4733 RepID=UPI003C2DE1C4
MTAAGRRGVVLNNASVSSVVGGLASHAYAASKHAVVGLTKNAAAELGQYGIRVNCISSYMYASALAVNAMNKEKKDLEAWISSMVNLKGAVLTADDVAKAALFLSSDETKYVSGHNFIIDGGLTTINNNFGLFKQ